MGVTGLWQLLGPVGRPIPLESLENKVLAIDVSIWLNQAVKGFRDNQGISQPNAHLVTLFHRVCKLLFFRIKPIFVFDGATPILKKQTVAARQRARQLAAEGSEQTAQHILANRLANELLNNAKDDSNSPSKRKRKIKPVIVDDMFHLPPMPENALDSQSDDEALSNSTSAPNNFEDEFQDLNEVDITSNEFLILPANIRHEIVSELKERRKKTFYEVKKMPVESESFSQFQMTRLLKRSELQRKLEQIEKEMSTQSADKFISELEGEIVESQNRKISSEDTVHSILIKTSKLKTSNKPAEEHQTDEPKLATVILDQEESDIDCPSHKLTSVTSKKLIFSADTSDSDSECPILVNPAVKKTIEIVLDKEYCKEDELFPSEIFENSSKPQITVQNQKSVITLDDFEDDSCPPVGISVPQKAGNSSNKPIIAERPKSLITLEDFEDDSCPVGIFEAKQAVSVPNKLENSTKQIDVESQKSVITLEDFEDDFFPSRIFETETVSKKVDVINDFQEPQKIPEVPERPVLEVQDVSAQSKRRQDDLNILLSPTKRKIAQVTQRYSGEELNEKLEAIQDTLEVETEILFQQKGRQDRQMATLSEQIYLESQDLLKLFGVPFIVSPSEAEAQCAKLELLGLTQGTITDDSDIWLFGGSHVYKNFFTQGKYLECFHMNDIKSQFGLDREKLICFALLTGSDYTEGIDGVGYVRAMEIIGEFKGEGLNVLDTFKGWWSSCQTTKRPPKNSVRAKFLKIDLPESFPNPHIFDAYVNPSVDDSKEKFTWGIPDLCSLRELAHDKFGWSQKKTDDMLLPILKKINEKKSQTRLDSFFQINLQKDKNLFPSKRLQKALTKLNDVDEDPDCPSSSSAPSSSKKSSSPSKRRIQSKEIPTFNRGAKKGKKLKANVIKEQVNLSESSSDSD